MRPVIVGVEGLRLMYFHLSFTGVIFVHSFTAVLMLRCNLFVMSWLERLKLLLEMNVRILLLYSSALIMTIELPLSAFVTMALASSSLVFI